MMREVKWGGNSICG